MAYFFWATLYVSQTHIVSNASPPFLLGNSADKVTNSTTRELIIILAEIRVRLSECHRHNKLLLQLAGAFGNVVHGGERQTAGIIVVATRKCLHCNCIPQHRRFCKHSLWFRISDRRSECNDMIRSSQSDHRVLDMKLLAGASILWGNEAQCFVEI